MTRRACWAMAGVSTFGAMTTDRLVTGIALSVVALGWLRAAAREAERRRLW